MCDELHSSVEYSLLLLSNWILSNSDDVRMRYRTEQTKIIYNSKCLFSHFILSMCVVFVGMRINFSDVAFKKVFVEIIITIIINEVNDVLIILFT